MTPDSPLFTKRIRHLSQALMISGALNIGILSLFLYWVLRERPPTPYCELKPARFEQQQVPLADLRGCSEILAQHSQLSFAQLVNCLSHTKLIENGYTERDLALASLIAFHHFDIHRALPKNTQPLQERLLAWKPKGQESPITLAIYPDLTQKQFDSLIHFATTEHWPFTAEGLFLLLQEQKRNRNDLNESLVETFFLTPEFWTVELLFNRGVHPVNNQDILTLLLDGNWTLLKHFVDQQRQLHDPSEARRQKFLLDYLKEGSSTAAGLLLKLEWDFSVKKLDDHQVIAILQLMSAQLPESTRFAKEMLASPRSTNVWKKASQWLYAQAGETMPKEWNHHKALVRFVSEKAVAELESKVLTPPPVPSPLPIIRPKVAIPTPIKSIPSAKSTSLAAQPIVRIKDSVIASKKTAEAKQKLPSLPATVPQTYTVQAGDTLWKIARIYGVKVDDLKANNGLNRDILKSGMILKIPQNEKKKNAADLRGTQKPKSQI